MTNEHFKGISILIPCEPTPQTVAELAWIKGFASEHAEWKDLLLGAGGREIDTGGTSGCQLSSSYMWTCVSDRACTLILRRFFCILEKQLSSTACLYIAGLGPNAAFSEI